MHKFHRFYDDDEERRKSQDPEAILRSIGLKKGFTFIDVGCGSGFFAIPAAKIVGQKGTVYGVDIDSDAIAILKEKASENGMKNLALKVGEAEETIFCRECGDIVFFGIVLHDFKNPTKVLSNARRMLKPTGRLIDLDWKKEQMSFGPPVQIRFDEGKAANMIRAAGFKIEKIDEIEPHQYMVTAKLDS